MYDDISMIKNSLHRPIKKIACDEIIDKYDCIMFDLFEQAQNNEN
jgi:hypothetical protein